MAQLTIFVRIQIIPTLTEQAFWRYFVGFHTIYAATSITTSKALT
jgi:hypothetical protein